MIIGRYNADTDTITLEVPGVKALAACGLRGKSGKMLPTLGYGQQQIAVPGVGVVRLMVNNVVTPAADCPYWRDAAADAAAATAVRETAARLAERAAADRARTAAAGSGRRG